MFSYRHAFHAGNHADVLKHAIAVWLMRYLGNKETPVTVIDTHAGAGVYALDGGQAAKSGESATGIARLWHRGDAPPLVADYLALVKAMNPDGRLRHYPGSPWCADRVLRSQDRLRLFELHPTDARLLDENLRELVAQAPPGSRPARGRRIIAERRDGFDALKALLPPPSRRGLVLIDPPYEDKNDYRRVVATLNDALQRFATGVYAVWYPVLQRMESRELPQRLKRLPAAEWLHVTLSIGGATPDGFGLRGSGMFILNPPWTLAPALEEAMPWLVAALGEDAGAGFTLETGKGAPPRASRGH